MTGYIRPMMVTALLLRALANPAAAQACARADFEAVVDQASSTLVELTQTNTPSFQDRLRQLKTKRGWTNEQLVREGAPFVRDDVVRAFDERSEGLLMKINSQGGTGADCGVLTDLRATLAELIQTQTRKWAHMFEKIDQELAK